jgi:hypothetical protein
MISSSANQSLAYPKEYKEYDNSWVLCLTVASDYNYMKSLYGQSIERKYWNEKFDKSFVVPRVTIKRDKTRIVPLISKRWHNQSIQKRYEEQRYTVMGMFDSKFLISSDFSYGEVTF